MPPKYPPINDATLVPFRAIEVQLDASPDMLDRPECPYAQHIRVFLKKLLKESAPVEHKEYSDEDLEFEIHDLYTELRNANVTSLDAKDQAQMLKTRADLLTRMVSLKERAMNVRDMGRFQRQVIETLEGHLTPAQRNEFLEQLAARNVR